MRIFHLIVLKVNQALISHMSCQLHRSMFKVCIHIITRTMALGFLTLKARRACIELSYKSESHSGRPQIICLCVYPNAHVQWKCEI